ncbi:transposable element Tcb1 transposase [Trichonephila clavipes]|nr:transposable element Tcb1 transposase [Trichonephila clavipes]
MQKRSNLSDVQKGMTIGFKAKDGSRMAKFVNCSRVGMVKVYQAWQNVTVLSQRRGKCGAPWAIDDRNEWRLRRRVRMNKRSTVEQLITQMNQEDTNNASRTTVQLTDLQSRSLVHAPMLITVYRQRRLEFVLQYHN